MKLAKLIVQGAECEKNFVKTAAGFLGDIFSNSKWFKLILNSVLQLTTHECYIYKTGTIFQDSNNSQNSRTASENVKKAYS